MKVHAEATSLVERIPALFAARSHCHEWAQQTPLMTTLPKRIQVIARLPSAAARIRPPFSAASSAVTSIHSDGEASFALSLCPTSSTLSNL